MDELSTLAGCLLWGLAVAIWLCNAFLFTLFAKLILLVL